MFTDIVDSTRLMSSAGNAAWAVILGEHHRLVRTVVGRHHGSIMTATGDGFSAWFGHPDDAVAAALRAAPGASSTPRSIVPGGAVQVRIGLATGSVFDLGSDVSGMAVAEAARVMSTAGAGETHISQSVIEHGLDPANCSVARAALVEGFAEADRDLRAGAGRCSVAVSRSSHRDSSQPTNTERSHQWG